MLLPGAGRHFDRQQPIGKRRLARQVDSPQRSAAKFADELQLTERLACRRELRRLSIAAQQVVTLKHDGQRLVPLRKSTVELRGIGRFAALFAEAEFFVDYADGGFLVGA